MKNKGIVLSKIFLVAMLAFGGGYLFDQIGIFLPWMLGPLFVIMLAKMKWRPYLYWPRIYRSIGLLVLGVQLGSSFTKEALQQMASHLPVMLISTVVTVLFTVISAWLMAKAMNISLNTAMLGSFPGGLTQMVVLSEELKDTDASAVAFMQTLRIVLVISIVPWLVTHVLTHESGDTVLSGDGSFFFLQYSGWHFLGFIAVTAVILWTGLKIRMPLPFLLGPLLAAVLFNLTGPEAPQIPSFWLNAAQLLIGAHLGFTLKLDTPGMFRKMFGMVFLHNLLLIGFCYGLALFWQWTTAVPMKELFLSIAPGGVAEMSVTALSVHVDVSIVTSFHLFRILFILFLLTPLIKWMGNKTAGSRAQQ
ncbi:AbrB family transcriptional regulator [Bacillus massiliglaciei]|uniref:AbrB family transcriptional regulator n=1 Tax=Bacillus massiliglaciei TaxID=1816693 RepID=UPI000B24AE2C|nr:AbrB family transcriptional regulator [Bacillus massiliglaciei]